MKKLSEYILETLNNSANLSKVIKDLEEIGFKCIDRTRISSIEQQSAYFGFNNISIFDKITDKIKLYNYYISGAWTNGEDAPDSRFNDFKYVIQLCPNNTKNVFDYIKKENNICWHITTIKNYKSILKDGLIKVKFNNEITNKKERTYLFPCKDAFKNFKTKTAIRAMAFSLSNMKNSGEIDYNILLKLDMSKTNIDKYLVDPDAPGFKAVYVFEPIHTNAITDVYKLEFPKTTILNYTKIK